jgi:predicted RNase H-like nuclease
MAIKHTVETLKLFPHNYQMPQLSSTDILLMAAKDMKDDLQNPHPEVTFACVGNNTISTLVDLAAIFKLTL